MRGIQVARRLTSVPRDSRIAAVLVERQALFACALLVAAAVAPDALAEEAAERASEGDRLYQRIEGERIYQHLCSPCHGREGRGDGPAAKFLDPKPRNFTTGLYKIKSTLVGSPPTDEDLVQTISRGIPGTAMPAWAGRLSGGQIRLVMGFVKSFSELFEFPPDKPLEVPAEPPATRERLERGRAAFVDPKAAACFNCHGTRGRGDGTEADRLKDDAGNKLVVRDLARPWTFRRGGSARDIFQTLSIGMEGTPMPSYVNTLSEEDRWALALFAASLGRRRSWLDYLLEDPYVTAGPSRPEGKQ